VVILSVGACIRKDDASYIPIDQDRAKPLIEALAEYYMDYDDYPKDLAALRPEYLTEIPKTTDNTRFSYKRSDIDGGYLLCFNYGRGPNCCYIPRLKGWDCSPAGAGKE
jgi:hypothetical protein